MPVCILWNVFLKIQPEVSSMYTASTKWMIGEWFSRYGAVTALSAALHVLRILYSVFRHLKKVRIASTYRAAAACFGLAHGQSVRSTHADVYLGAAEIQRTRDAGVTGFGGSEQCVVDGQREKGNFSHCRVEWRRRIGGFNYVAT